MSDTLRLRFNHPDEKIFCSRCGRQCEPLGHLMAMFLICPTHGEFTIAPIVIQDTGRLADRGRSWVEGDGSWWIEFPDETAKAMWETCREVDARGLSGRATRTGP